MRRAASSPPDRICWIKSREGRWLNRRFQQPLTLLPELYRGNALQIEAMAAAATLEELFERLEDAGVLLRVDPDTPATFTRAAILSEAEMVLLPQIEDVVRLGRVRRIEPDRIVLDDGSVPTTPGTLHVHCAARGVARLPLRPIFDGERMTVQPTMFGSASYMSAFLGVVEALLGDDDEKNRLCRPIVTWENDVEFLEAFLARMNVDLGASRYPELAQWTRTTRLNPASGLAACIDDPVVVDARERTKQHARAAVENLRRLLADAAPVPGDRGRV